MTGHSLGGAAAALMAYDVYEYSRGRAAALLYTYGMPRVGDFEFAKALNARVANAYRIVHARDIVPHLPPCVGLLGCSQGKAMPHHTATEVFYPNAMRSGDNFTICDGSGEDSHCSNGVAHISVSDHCSYFGINNCAICCREEASHNFVSSPADSFLKLLFT
uniref:Fungal lipase-type domain-containing protein n=2 Tax=Chrysotila carterae TaxID=13221 RepID=A0A7S4BAZ7_CHRCT|eukprot:5510349-Pleurochrysis_carterae.AAC.3